MAEIPLPPYRKLLGFQLLVLGVLALLLEWAWSGSGFSALLGGLIAWIPQSVFAWMVFRHRGARRMNQSVRDLMLGEGLKLGLTFVLFIVVFVGVQPSNPISLICAYSVVLLLHWLAPWLLKQNKPR